MNSLKISDVTSYDFNLLGTGVELIVRQATGSTTIHLLPAHKDQPIVDLANQYTVTALPAEPPITATPVVTAVPKTSTRSTPKRCRRTLRKPGGASRTRSFQAQGALRQSDGAPVATKLQEREVRMIRELWPDALKGASSKRQALIQLGEMFDISAANIDQIITNRTWKHIL